MHNDPWNDPWVDRYLADKAVDPPHCEVPRCRNVATITMQIAPGTVIKVCKEHEDI